MICPNCRTENRHHAKYCDECGYELPSVESPSPVAAHSADSAFNVSDTQMLTQPLDELDGLPTERLEGEPDCSHSAFEADDDAPTIPVIRPLSQSSTVYSSPAPNTQQTHPSTTGMFATPDSGQGRLYASQTDHEDRPGKGRRGRRVALIAALIALAVLAILGITYLAQTWGGRPVPDVSGMSQVDATYAVKEAGFSVQIEEVTSDEVEGIVLSTDPRAGSRLPEGATVTLRISVARLVPDVVGKPLEEAQSLLGEAGFTNVEVTKTKSNEPENTVLAVTPQALTRARADALISIEVAEPFTVVDVTGKSQDEATALLEAEGYKVSIAQYNTEDAAEGTAVKTDPAAGSACPSGSDVTLYIAHNRSAELVSLTRQFFSSSPTITIDGSLYEMSRLGDVSYSGGNTCAFSITVRPIQTVTWFGTQTETRYGNYETIQGSVTYTDSNSIASIEPAIKQGS